MCGLGCANPTIVNICTSVIHMTTPLHLLQEEQFVDNAIMAFRVEIATMVNEFLLNQGRYLSPSTCMASVVSLGMIPSLSIRSEQEEEAGNIASSSLP